MPSAQNPDKTTLETYLETASAAALAAGVTLKQAFGGTLEVDEKKAYDIKLALDRETQAFLESRLLGAYPGHVVLGEEGNTGDQDAPYQWVIDPTTDCKEFAFGRVSFTRHP